MKRRELIAAAALPTAVAGARAKRRPVLMHAGTMPACYRSRNSSTRFATWIGSIRRSPTRGSRPRSCIELRRRRRQFGISVRPDGDGPPPLRLQVEPVERQAFNLTPVGPNG